MDAVTAKPVARALVVSQDRRLGTMTDGDGRFALAVTVLPAAPKDLEVQLVASRPGYLQRVVEVSLAPKLAGEITIRIEPAAVLSGHVSAAGAADGAQNVVVQLFSSMRGEHGTYLWQPQASQSTDSHGNFSFSDLAAGDYTVRTSPWLADDLYPPRTGPAQQYPATYYGDSRTVEGALKVHLGAGVQASAEIALHLVTYYPVHVPLEGKVAKDNLRLDSPDTSTNSGLSFAYLPAQGVYECWFEAGAHTLNFVARAEQLWGQVTINVVDAPLRTAPVVLRPMISVPVKLHEQYTHPEQKSRQELDAAQIKGRDGPKLAPVQIYLFQTGESTVDSNSIVENGQMVMGALPPGTYKVGASATHGYVAALSSGSTDLLRQPLVLGSSGPPEPIEVTLRDDGARVEATVDFGSLPLPHRAQVLLEPADGTVHVDVAITDSNGVATLENIAPGSYRAHAVSVEADEVSWSPGGPEFVGLDPVSASVTVLPGQKVTIRIPFTAGAEDAGAP